MDEFLILLALPITMCLTIVFCFLLIKTNEQYNASDEMRFTIFIALFYLCAALPIVITGRNLGAVNLMDDLSAMGGGGPYVIVKLLSYIPILLCLVIIYQCVLSPLFSTGNRRAPILFVESAVILAFAFPLLLSIFFSTGPVDNLISRMYGPLIIFSAGLISNIRTSIVVRGIKACILSIVLISYAYLVISPYVVLEPYSSGLISFIPYRFWGIAPHANSFSPLVAILLILELYSPFKHKLIHRCVIAVVILTLALAQSKTIWLALVIVMFILLLFEVNNKIKDRLTRVFFILLIIGCCLALIGAVYIDDSSALGSLLFKKEYGGGDFSGRVGIWRQSLLEFFRNPLFGYGPSIWSQEYRLNNGMNYAFHAHSQFFQLIGEYGFIGLSLFCVYIFAIMNGIRYIKHDYRKIVVAIFILLSIRSISEPTFRTGNAFGGDMMLHLAFYCIFISALKQSIESKIAKSE